MDDRKIRSASGLQIRQEDEDRYTVCSNEKGFETNSVGVRIIEICGNGITFSAMVALIKDEFDAPDDEISSDLRMMVPEMIKNKILNYEEN
jgi:Coenzyme PQQ synthesis protein D (PqqD).